MSPQIRLLLAVLAALLAAGPASAQSDPTELARLAADRLDAAQAALTAANSAHDRVDALSRTIGAYEDGLDALREGLRQAALREAAILGQFNATSDEVSRLLGVLMGIQGAQGPLGLIHPAGPLGAARSGMILSDVTPAIQARAADLEARLRELAVIRGLQEGAADLLSRGLAGAQAARTALSQAMSDRRDLPRRFLGDEAAMADLRDSAETLQDFATGLLEMDAGKNFDGVVRSFDDARGTLPLPVRGRILRGYDEADAAGIHRPGLILVTRPQALVTTPWAATVLYAGPLLDYENVIVLEPEAATLLILAGMKVVYGEVGQVLQPGSPVGLMGGSVPDAGALLLDAANGAGSSQSETLYIELRQGAEPVDPTGWFSETKDKAE